MADFDAVLGERGPDEASHLLVAYSGEHGAAHAEAGGSDGDVGRAAADVLAEGGRIFEARTLLLAVEVDAGAAHADQIQRSPPCRVSCRRTQSCTPFSTLVD